MMEWAGVYGYLHSVLWHPYTQGLEDMPFQKGVGPWSILWTMAKGEGLTTYIHTEDNQVQYFYTKRDGEGNIKSVSYINKINDLQKVLHL